MRIVRAMLNADYGTRVFTLEEQTAIQAAHISLEDEQVEFDEDGKPKSYYQKRMWDLDLIPVDLVRYFAEIASLKLPTKLAEVLQTRPSVVYNEHVKVVMPGLGMLQFNHVKVEYDCCTDSLQARLNEGWRILAICPQPDQRRPDYVLGRVSTEE